MSSEVRISESPRRSRFQFSLFGLLSFALATAVALSVATLPHSSWHEGLLAGVASLMTMGLWWQARDIRRALGLPGELEGSQRWTWRVEIVWRQAIVVLLVGYYLVLCSTQLKILSLPERPDGNVPLGELMRSTIFYLLLAMVLDRSYSRPAAAVPKWRARLLAVMGALAAIWLCVLLWSQHCCVDFLVYCAVTGMELASPLRFAPAGVPLIPGVRAERFLMVSTAACLLVLLNLGLIAILARQWQRGMRRRLLWTGLWGINATASAAAAIWLLGPGLYQLSPLYSMGRQCGAPHLWVTAFLLVAILTAAAALRWPGVADGPVTPLPAQAMRPHTHYHERPGVLFVLALVMALESLAVISLLLGFASSWEMLAWLPAFLPFYVPFVVLVLAIHRWIRALRMRPADRPTPNGLVPGAFWAVWLTLLLTTVFALPAIASFSVIIWTAPKHLFPWPFVGG